MNILIDAFGGDHSPDEVIKGVIAALPYTTSDITLVGRLKTINQKVKEFYGKDNIEEISPRLKIVNAEDVITNDDKPTVAIKTMKDSSMVVGLNLLKEGKGDIFISAGSTGALLTGGLLLVGRIKGVDRPAIAGILPAYKQQLLLIDSGSNTNCKPINLVQFAQMGNIYCKYAMGVKKPRIGLLNIGTEESKGNELTKETYVLLKEMGERGEINFIGNIEGRHAFNGSVDIVVTDGFTGNVFLKSVEGFGKLVKKLLTEELKKNIFTKVGALFSLPSINKFARRVDYKEYGGAVFLGVNKPVIKAHGSGDEKVFKFTIMQAEKYIKNDTANKMKDEFKSVDSNKS